MVSQDPIHIVSSFKLEDLSFLYTLKEAFEIWDEEMWFTDPDRRRLAQGLEMNFYRKVLKRISEFAGVEYRPSGNALSGSAAVIPLPLRCLQSKILRSVHLGDAIDILYLPEVLNKEMKQRVAIVVYIWHGFLRIRGQQFKPLCDPGKLWHAMMKNPVS